ncbi:MAG: Uncharacterized protein XD46_1332 [Euryarchaeota archaeon 55_53]|nr:MAG: Uncharacterized protein XD46_1332 [Euryarchaeota archaeon 55_53]
MTFHTITFYGNKVIISAQDQATGATFHTITFYGNSNFKLIGVVGHSIFPHDYVLRKRTRTRKR